MLDDSWGVSGGGESRDPADDLLMSDGDRSSAAVSLLSTSMYRYWLAITASQVAHGPRSFAEVYVEDVVVVCWCSCFDILDVAACFLMVDDYSCGKQRRVC